MKKKMMALYLGFSVVISGLGAGNVNKAEAANQTIAALHYTYSSLAADTETKGNVTDLTLKKTKYGSKKDGYNFSTGSAKLYASIDGSSKRKLEWSKDNYSYGTKKVKQPAMTAGKKNPWKSGTKPYFEMQFSTKGYNAVNFSAYVGATKKGPKSYQLSYAVGNSNTFKKISGSEITLKDNKKMQKISAALPAAALNQGQVKVRIVVYSMVSLEGALLYNNSTSGEAAINHITVSGTKGTVYTVKKLILNKKSLTLKKGKSASLKATLTVSPNTAAAKKAAKKQLTFKSSNAKVAAVNKSGKITAKKAGSATITVTCGKKSGTCKVKVNE